MSDDPDAAANVAAPIRKLCDWYLIVSNPQNVSANLSYAVKN